MLHSKKVHKFPTQQEKSWVPCTAGKVMVFLQAKRLRDFSARQEGFRSFLHCQKGFYAERNLMFSAQHKLFITLLRWKLVQRLYQCLSGLY
jgi:hypothetical protein